MGNLKQNNFSVFVITYIHIHIICAFVLCFGHVTLISKADPYYLNRKPMKVLPRHLITNFQLHLSSTPRKFGSEPDRFLCSVTKRKFMSRVPFSPRQTVENGEVTFTGVLAELKRN